MPATPEFSDCPLAYSSPYREDHSRRSKQLTLIASATEGFWRAFDEGGRGDTLRAESTGVEPSETSRAEEDDGWGDFQDT